MTPNVDQLFARVLNTPAGKELMAYLRSITMERYWCGCVGRCRSFFGRAAFFSAPNGKFNSARMRGARNCGKRRNKWLKKTKSLFWTKFRNRTK